MKRPASSQLRRPASSFEGSLNQTINKMKAVATHEQEEIDDHDEEETEAGRDKSKGQKYVKMKNELPEHVVDLIEKQSAKSASPREFKTQIINKLFTRDSNGKLVLNLDDPVFTEHKKIFMKKYSKETETALPESVLRGLYFNNSQTALDEAKAAGDVVPVERPDGRTFWCFEAMEKGVVAGKMEEQEINQKKKVSKDQLKLLADNFAAVGWTWKYQDKDVSSLADAKKIPAAILNIVNQATDSQSKLMKEAMSMIKNWKGEKENRDLVALKHGHATCSQNLAKLQHMKEFQELPGDMAPTRANLDKIMMEMAVHTKDYNELVETCRGRLRALKK